MQITTKTEYSVRALSQIECCGQPAISIREICQRQNLPEKYMEQLFRKLKQAGILDSVPGSKGGYRLSRPAADINLHEIMLAVEDGTYQPLCETKLSDSLFCLGSPCILKQIWVEAYEHMKQFLEQITLQTIKDRLKESEHE